MEQPFFVWFGLLGLVVGGAVVWVFLAEHPFETKEEPWWPPDQLEAGFLARRMTERGRDLDEETVAELLELHSEYLEGRIRNEEPPLTDEPPGDAAPADPEAQPVVAATAANGSPEPGPAATEDDAGR